MFAYITRYMRDRRTNLFAQRITRCQKKICSIDEQLHDYRAEQGILMDKLLSEGDSSKAIRLIIVSDEITHLRFQRDMYTDDVHRLRKQLVHLRGTTSLLNNDDYTIRR